MKLKELTLENCEQVRQWRNNCLESLRTPFPLTKEMQERFYHDIVCDRNARARYWGIHEEMNIPFSKDFLEKIIPRPEKDYYEDILIIGMVGLENIELENRRGEISIILNPDCRGKGYGEQAVDLLLEQGFMYLNLDNIWGEVYSCNKATAFWAKILKKYNGSSAILPNTKYWYRKYCYSTFFNIAKEEWLKCQK
jgi:RimJ/RimL family protein N-acetyltransferase